MQITRKSIVTGKVHTVDLPINEYQLARYEGGALAQDAFPELDADGREFIISGITPEEWTATFPEDN